MSIFKTKATVYIVFCAFISLCSASFASAEPITFDFRFEGGGGGPVAVGYIVFEKSLLPNPGSGPFDLPHLSGVPMGPSWIYLVNWSGSRHPEILGARLPAMVAISILQALPVAKAHMVFFALHCVLGRREVSPCNACR